MPSLVRAQRQPRARCVLERRSALSCSEAAVEALDLAPDGVPATDAASLTRIH